MKLLSNLMHRVRMFFNRKRARKVVASMELDTYKTSTVADSDCARGVYLPTPEYGKYDDLTIKIENKRRELGYVRPHEDKIFSVQHGNKITWYRQKPDQKPVIFKEIYLNGKAQSN